MRVILIAGLPGSGKTYLANYFASKTEGTVVVDDITDLNQLPESANQLVITDVNFCDPKVREKAEKKLRAKYLWCSIEWYFFENAASKCRKNVLHRNDGRNVESTISRFEKTYEVPIAYVPLQVWQ